jgi:paraquat-inducible protein A
LSAHYREDWRSRRISGDDLISNPNIIACPHCDVIHRYSQAELTTPTCCARCGHRLTLGKSDAIVRVVGLASASPILLVTILLAPFLSLEAGPVASTASVLDIVLGFGSGMMMPLAAVVLALILVVPTARSLLLIYSLAPLLAGRRNAGGAERALRWAFLLKPWAMAEIFMLSAAVALVKLAGLATIKTGTAFWAFVLFVAANALQDTFMCRNTLWTSVEKNAA